MPVAKLDQIASGQATTVAASDTIVTGLKRVTAVAIAFNDPPIANAQYVTADVGDQAGTPAAGSFLLKTWTSALAAASTFGRKVNWVAYGTNDA